MVCKQRLRELDVLRGVAIISVIAAHSILVYPIDFSTLPFFQRLLEFIEAYYMPLFFLISGYVLRKKKYLDFIAEKASRLLVPYVFFSLVDSLCRNWGGYW